MDSRIGIDQVADVKMDSVGTKGMHAANGISIRDKWRRDVEIGELACMQEAGVGWKASPKDADYDRTGCGLGDRQLPDGEGFIVGGEPECLVDLWRDHFVR